MPRHGRLLHCGKRMLAGSDEQPVTNCGILSQRCSAPHTPAASPKGSDQRELEGPLHITLIGYLLLCLTACHTI